MFTEKIKTASVACAIGIACLFPVIAQAQVRILQYTGISDLESDVTVTFSLDTFVEDSNPADPNVGEFLGAIQNFTDSGNPDPNKNLSPLFFTSGNLTASRLTTDPAGNFPGLSFGYEAITDNTPSSAFNNDGLRYEVTFPNGTERLTLFIPSNDPNLINSLSNFSDLLRTTDNIIQGVVSRPDVGREERFIVTNPDPNRSGFNFATVPEPAATASLISLGALSAIAFRGRNKHLL